MTTSEPRPEPRPQKDPSEPAPAPGEPVAPPATTEAAHASQPVSRTRIGTTHMALVAGLVVLVVLLVFILENTRRIPVTFFGATGRLPLGVALLLAAVAGALILGIVGTVRIGQFAPTTATGTHPSTPPVRDPGYSRTSVRRSVPQLAKNRRGRGTVAVARWLLRNWGVVRWA